MSDPKNFSEQPTNSQPEAADEITEETRALVEKAMPDESDEVKEHLVGLVNAIKKRAQAQSQAAGDMSREAYLQAVRQAKEALDTVGKFTQDSQKSIEKAVSTVEEEARSNWESILKETEKIGHRLDKAAAAAWEILTAPDESESSENSKTGESNSDKET